MYDELFYRESTARGISFCPQLMLGPPNNRVTEVMSFVVFSVSGKFTVYGRPTGAT